LEAVFAAGYRVRSQRGTEFRQSATTPLEEFLRKSFVMDDERQRSGKISAMTILVNGLLAFATLGIPSVEFIRKLLISTLPAWITNLLHRSRKNSAPSSKQNALGDPRSTCR